jgi:hypothetical protein
LAHSAEVVVVVAALTGLELLLHSAQVSELAALVVVEAFTGLELLLHAAQVSELAALVVVEEAFTGVGVATTQT